MSQYDIITLWHAMTSFYYIMMSLYQADIIMQHYDVFFLTLLYLHYADIIILCYMSLHYANTIMLWFHYIMLIEVYYIMMSLD